MHNSEFTPEQDAERHELLGLDPTHNSDIMRFEGITLETLKELVEKGFADADAQQNDAPTIGEFIEWMEQQLQIGNDTITAHGYIVTNKRSDRRISIEGLEHASEVPDHMSAWWKFNRQADECDEYRSWWD